MEEYREIEKRIAKLANLKKRPVAVKFMAASPTSIAKFERTQPSGCSFWRIAAPGETFYTIPSDHYNCPIGSHTHSIPLPPERAKDLEQTLSLITSIGYIQMSEVHGIPQLASPPGAVVYAPLGETPAAPDVVIFAGNASQIMLIQEAAQRAGRAAQFPMLGRPTCMAIPASMAKSAVVSSGCIGNRVYTDLADGELYAFIPEKDLSCIADTLETIASANAKLYEYHHGRRQEISTQ